MTPTERHADRQPPSDPADVRSTPLGRATLGDQLRRQARRQPDKTAMITYTGTGDRVEISYRELHRRVTATVDLLTGLGVRHGDVVATLLPASVDLAVTYFAALSIGAPFTPVNPRLTDEELDRQLRHATPRVLVVDDADRPRIATLTDDAAPPVVLDRTRLPEPTGADSHVDHPVHENDVAAIIYTSGTENAPKGVMLSHRNFLIGTTPAWVYANYLVENDVFLLLAPGYTMAGLGTVTNVLSVGATVVIAADADPASVLAVVARDRVTVTSQTPTFYRRLAAAATPGHDLRSLRQIHVYGGAIPAAAVDRFAALAPQVEWGTYWGQSELSQLGSVGYFRTLADIPDGNLRWIGRPMPHLEVRVLDESGADAEVGELVCRSPATMLGYHRDRDRTAAVLGDGWLRTGDIVRTDRAGNLFFEDRRKDMIKTGGMNVSAGEVEAVIARHPAVETVAVLGLPDEEWSEIVVAVLVTRPGQHTDEADIRAFCRRHLVGYKVPKRVEFATDLPYDAQGKLRKRELRSRIEAS
ncbi:class I adenylate-forming enzyme family protein [Micromonospora cathayae]|uniref:Class I adenylate-forming enzyme family protein n=1 Tax=Micromonospora cathayae TaxID=3028804 RepID=A0ABY7ZLM8_9ACTN|nr:class I adenylate-forming enzyme family protein [Micromonospora sp. HUAS 3]WDZ83805.1 class I adenylate-forming enzyme family protein [Micromonospora sp. HUAS 3]